LRSGPRTTGTTSMFLRLSIRGCASSAIARPQKARHSDIPCVPLNGISITYHHPVSKLELFPGSISKRSIKAQLDWYVL
jgi:hypothetical protein